MTDQRRRTARRRRLRRDMLIVLFLLALTVGVFYGLNSPYFHVATIEIHGLQALTEDQIVDWTSLEGPLPIWRVDAANIAARLEAQPQVAGVAVARHWPNRISIDLWERRALAYAAYHDMWLALDDAGLPFALSPAPPADGIIIEGLGLLDQRLGESLPPRTEAAVLCALFVVQFDMAWVERVRLEDDGELTLFLTGSVPARLGRGEENLRQRLAALAALWGQWRDRPEDVLYFDLRNPVRPAVKLKAGHTDT